MKYILSSFLLLFGWQLNAQTISGKILEKPDEPLIGASVRWVQNPQNATFTDENGEFEILRNNLQHQLVISYIGYITDSVMAHGDGPFTFYLSPDNQNLEEVVVKSSSTAIDRISPMQTQIITTKELAKAACCNLSESFETNASVSVSYADAITGARQIQMMGLAGKYVQTNIENMPGVRGLSIPFGLSYVPGTWIQSIDVAKGVSSVINGYESMSGAINVELQKPDLAERLYANAYVNEVGRGELNLNAAKKLNDKWSVGLLTHASALKNEVDRNGDSFMDLPTYDQINVLNRWKYSGERFMGQVGINYLNENREGGEIVNPVLSRSSYRFLNKTQKFTAFSKTAILFPETPYRGLGLIMNASFLDGNSQFGLNNYDSKENSFYANLIYQDIFGNTQHTYKTGLSFLADQYDEAFDNFGDALLLKRNEIVPGAFFEYTYNKLDKTILVAGLRADAHNLFGLQITPRLHLKQDLGASTVMRLSVGKGMRVPTPLAENYGKLVSSRKVELLDAIQPEYSWNFGGSITQSFGKNSLILDAYHSLFTSQQIMDMETPGSLLFYQSFDKSYATSAQAELILVPSDRWEVKAAWRLLDVKQTMKTDDGGTRLVDKPFVPRSFALLNVGYAMPYNKWKADATLQYRGKQRLPGSDERIDGFVTLNTQLSRNFVNWEYYLGVENLTNFRQSNPIINPQNPFDQAFDAGQIWGPVVGRMVYAGARFRIR
ncbi:TonB-dependent receptor [Jiulongibacter sediminis]|uniref:TonB-dependent receptor n=1 Tax=Jiulongibacter sediminis TaxID=1605367 RepID=UPI0026EDBA2A|nr:TonB-dependent receptor [Jiulongibacter sediminis]